MQMEPLGKRAFCALKARHITGLAALSAFMVLGVFGERPVSAQSDIVLSDVIPPPSTGGSSSGSENNTVPVVIPVTITPTFLSDLANLRRRLTSVQAGSAGQRLISEFSITTGGAKISPQQLAALQKALEVVDRAGSQFETEVASLATQKGTVPRSALNPTISALNDLGAALFALSKQIAALPRNGSILQLQSMIAAVDEISSYVTPLQGLAAELRTSIGK